jgi:hypothetical protein
MEFMMWCFFRKPDPMAQYKSGYVSARLYTRENPTNPINAWERAALGYDQFDRGWDDGTRAELRLQYRLGQDYGH